MVCKKEKGEGCYFLIIELKWREASHMGSLPALPDLARSEDWYSLMSDMRFTS